MTIFIYRTAPFCGPFDQFTIYSLDGILKCPLAEYTPPAVAVEFVVISSIIAVVCVYATVHIWSTFNGLLRRFFLMAKSVVRDNLLSRRQQFFPIIFFLFLFVLLTNLSGMLPYATTLTSSFVFTLFLAIFHYAGANILGITRNGWYFITIFLPQGLPLAISLLLVLIETISYIARGLSLSIRLFANMFAGHVLLKLMSAKVPQLLFTGGADLIISLPLWAALTPIIVLELLVAFLQAYVFSLLATLYINDPLANRSSTH